MSYVKESGVGAARRRRHRRAAITLTLCVLLLVGTGGYAVAYYQRWLGDPASGRAGCTPTATASTRQNPLAPSNIDVNIYNATNRSGLAGDVARSMRSRDFSVGTVSNDPLNRTVDGPAEIRFGTKGAESAKKVIAKQIKGAHLVPDARTDASVDLVIGKKFTKLLPASTKSEPTTKAAAPTC